MTEPASSQRRGLGRGLAVLIGQPAGPAELHELPVGAIRPNRRQPRKRLDSESVSELAESVRVQGVVQPILVRPAEEGYELIAGERRWRAARAAGLPTIPAVVREAEDRDTLLLALVENVARENLTAVEEARAYAALLDEFGLTLAEVAERVGRSKPSVSNRLRLLDLPGGRPRARRARPADGGTRAGRAGGARPRGTSPARAQDRPQRHVRTGGRARGALGRCTCSAEDGEITRRPGADRPCPRGPCSADGSGRPSRPGPTRAALRGRDRAGRAVRGARVRRGPAAARVLSPNGVSSPVLQPVPADAGPTPGRTMHASSGD